MTGSRAVATGATIATASAVSGDGAIVEQADIAKQSIHAVDRATRGVAASATRQTIIAMAAELPRRLSITARRAGRTVSAIDALSEVKFATNA